MKFSMDAARYANLTPQDLEAGGYDVKTACQLFEMQAQRVPQQTALLYQDVTLSYEHLNEKTNQLARYIRKQYRLAMQKELTPNALIPISIARSADFVIGILAILKAGGAYVPINPEYPEQRIKHILAEIGSNIILTEPHLFEKFKQFDTKLVTLTIDEDGLNAEDKTNLPLPLTANDLAYVIYTSGSSGTPKGVMASHATLISQTVCASYFYADETDTVAFFSDVSFDSTTTEIWGALLSGARLFIPDNFFELLSEPQLFKTTVVEKKLSVILLTRALFDLLYSLDETVFAAVNFMMVGGEALTKHIMLKLAQSPYKPPLLINAYGPTENSTFCTTYPIADDFSRYHSVPIGRPYSNRIGLVLDKHLQLLPIGVTGELFVSGTSLSKGYLNHPALTNDKFIPNPYFTESGANYARLYKTNDLVRWLPEGNLEYVGRNDCMVKLRGYRIELGEIETRMAELPQVSHSVVVMEKNDTLSYLVGYYVAPQAIDDARFKEQLIKTLPDYMIPSVFVYLKTLPVTSNGKLDRKALPKANFAEKPTLSPTLNQDHTIEHIIAEIWSRTLHINHIDNEQSFFNLGGNSLAAMIVRKELEKACGIKINIVDLFQFPSVNVLAERVKQLQKEAGITVRERLTSEKAAPLNPAKQEVDDPIAIVGMACRLPGVNNPQEFWQLLGDGKTNLRDFSLDELKQNQVNATNIDDANYVKRGAVFETPFLFDAAFFGYSVKDAELMDPQHRQFLQCAWEALEQSGTIPEKYHGEIAVFATQGRNTYFMDHVYPTLANDPKLFQAILGNEKDFLSSRVSYKLNLTGPSITTQTACSSSLVSIQLACESLKARSCDLALAGGVSIFYNYGYTYHNDLIESPDGFCRAFDAQARGTVITSGVGIVVLKRLRDAIADKDSIYALIKGGAVNNDGAAKMAFTAPSVNGQMHVIQKALDNAKVTADTISYVESHGTGTMLGDPIEWTALHQVYQQYSREKEYCTIGALKTNIGHTDSAAGVLGLMKASLALKNKCLPATLNFCALNPEIASFNTLFKVSKQTTPWPTTGKLRRAAVSSFGLGGTNAHMILEEYGADVKMDSVNNAYYLIPFSAKNSISFCALAEQYQHFIKTLSASEIVNAAFTAQYGRAEFKERGFFMVSAEQPHMLGSYVENDGGNVGWFIAASSTIVKIMVDALQRVSSQEDLTKYKAIIEFVTLQFLGRLWAYGIAIEWQQFPASARKIPIPTYPYNQQHYEIAKPSQSLDMPVSQPVVTEGQSLENQLKSMWATVLGVNEKELAADSDFIGLGGDSLAYIDLFNLIKKRISKHITLEEIVAIIDFGSMREFISMKVVENEAA